MFGLGRDSYAVRRFGDVHEKIWLNANILCGACQFININHFLQFLQNLIEEHILFSSIFINKNKSIILIIFVIVSYFVFPQLCIAQEKNTNKSSSKISKDASQGAAGVASSSIEQSVSSAFVQYARSAGVQKCLGRIDQVVSFLAGNSRGVGGHFFIPPSQSDNMMISLSMEVQQFAEGSAYVSATFAPNQSNGCGGVYETVVYWPYSCEDVASKQYSNLRRVGQLSNNIIVLNGGESLKIFLMPAGTGCVAIKKELIK